MSEFPCIILLDNGSIRASSTLNLRDLAERLSARSGRGVHAVSHLHSDKIPKSDLNGVPAETLEPFLHATINRGASSFLILPLFFGQSAAVYEFIPQRLREIQNHWPKLEVRIAPCLVNVDDETDDAISKILSNIVRRTISSENLQRPSIAVVDHGTPRAAVNKSRNLVCNQMRDELRGEYGEVKAASMERRSGSEYDFNEPLLENLLGSTGFENDVVASLLFSSPGRHAGVGGDIDKICRQAELSNKGLRVVIADLPSTDESFVDLLALRLNQGLSTSPLIN